MSRPVLTLAPLALALAAPCTATQSVADRVARASGTVRLSFAARPQVCGNGEFIGENTPDAFYTYRIGPDHFSLSRNEDFQPNCTEGPVRLAFERAGDRVTGLRAAVGVAWRADPTVTDLGTVPAGEAAAWLVGAAARLPDTDARVALLAASLADSADVVRPMLDLIGNRTLTSGVRREAMRWVRTPAERARRADDVDRAVRAIVENTEETAETREFALRQLGVSRSAANATWIERVALDTRAPEPLRERALRVLGEEMGAPERARALYGRLDRASLKERVVRLAAESPGSEAGPWLAGIARARDEPEAVRDRAIRSLGERRDVATLRGLYDDLDRPGLRERIIRSIAETGGDEGRAWLEALVMRRGEHEALRERALRSLAEHGAATALLASLYDRLEARTLRVRVIRLLAERGDRAAVEKLESILARETDADLRREAERRLAERG